MSTRQLGSYQEIITIPIKDRWTACTIGLEHSVSGDNYWLACEIKFFVGEDTDMFIFIGPGSRSDEEIIISYLENNRFKLVLRRAMREWEYFDYQRE
jgi:hypothetical protein